MQMYTHRAEFPSVKGSMAIPIFTLTIPTLNLAGADLSHIYFAKGETKSIDSDMCTHLCCKDLLKVTEVDKNS